MPLSTFLSAGGAQKPIRSSLLFATFLSHPPEPPKEEEPLEHSSRISADAREGIR